MRCARTAAALTVKLGFNSRPRAKFAVKTAWVREGALRAPPRIDGAFTANFARGRKLNPNFTVRAAAVRAHRMKPPNT